MTWLIFVIIAVCLESYCIFICVLLYLSLRTYAFLSFFFFLMIRRPPRSTLDRSSAASDVYKRQDRLGLVLSAAGAGTHAGRQRLAAGGGFLPRGTGRCLLYTSPSPRDRTRSRMPSSA